MTAHAFLLQCITNLHVGSGDANYGIVDKLVQRDTVFNYPTIHASSLKGALREYFEKKWEAKDVDEIFGKKTDIDADAESGNCNFLSADLLALPVRCSHNQFALSFCYQNLDFLNRKSQLLIEKEIFKIPAELNKLYTKDDIKEVYLEDDILETTTHVNIFSLDFKVDNFTAFDNQYAFVDNAKFDVYAQNLPVIARNRVGKNKNLWYEEVVPHQSIFLTYFIPNTLADESIFNRFISELKTGIFQIGANSSVGYGLCKFHEILKTESHE